MLLSKRCTYGLRASLLLAVDTNSGYVAIKELSNKLDISFYFLGKIIQRLTAKNILKSQKGPKGGVCLAAPSDEISLLDVVLAIEGNDFFKECILGLPGCGTQTPCPMHHLWETNRDEIQNMLATHSLQEVAEKGKSEDLRITATGNFEWSDLQ